jgi:hypothetical protein
LDTPGEGVASDNPTGHGRPSKRLAGSRSEAQPPGARMAVPVMHTSTEHAGCKGGAACCGHFLTATIERKKRTPGRFDSFAHAPIDPAVGRIVWPLVRSKVRTFQANWYHCPIERLPSNRETRTVTNSILAKPSAGLKCSPEGVEVRRIRHSSRKTARLEVRLVPCQPARNRAATPIQAVLAIFSCNGFGVPSRTSGRPKTAEQQHLESHE